MANYDEKKKQREKERQKLRKKQSRKANAAGAASYWLLAPLIAILSFVPLVTYCIRYNTHLAGFDWYVSDKMQYDVFLYCKMIVLICIAVYMIVALLFHFLSNQKKPSFHKMMIPLGIYGILTLLSAILSENSYFSFAGSQDRFEPVWILLTYCLIVYYTYNIIQSEESIKKIMKWFLVGIAIMLILGVAQGTAHDPLRLKAIQSLLGMPEEVDFKVVENVVYLTLCNPNYVGGYIALITPILMSFLIHAKKNWQKLLIAVMFLADIFTLYQSESKAGIIAFGFMVIVYIVLYRKKLFKNWKIGIGVLMFIIVGFVGVNAYFKNEMIIKLKNAFTRQEVDYPLKSIETKEDCVRIEYNEQVVNFSLEQDNQGRFDVKAVRDDGSVVESVYNEENCYNYIQDERMPLAYGVMRTDDFYGFVVEINGIQWIFSNVLKEDDTSYYFYNAGKAIKLEKIKYNQFLERHGNFATERGFIWARTLPLLKDYFLLGSGPDTFIVAYPNNDFVAQVNHDFINGDVTKPHCLYLQIAVQTGVPSLICVLIFFGWYIIDSLKLYWKKEITGYLSTMGVAILIGVLGFLVTGLTNDSMNGVTPIFYLLIGIGITINQIIRKQEEVSENHTI